MNKREFTRTMTGGYERLEPTTDDARGYINGYRWGVEYLTNGKRPDLADDAIIRYWIGECISDEAKVASLNWSQNTGECYPIIKFKITDQRYKPSDTSYLDAPTIKESLTAEWYDYDNQKAIALPPVGVVVNVLGAGNPINATVVAHDDGRAVLKFRSCDSGDALYTSSLMKNLRPLDHATRKAEEEKKRVVDAAMAIAVDAHMTEDILGSLYDAGYLKLPE